MEKNSIITPSPKDFNLMVAGQIISILGSALLRFALSLYILDMTGRADIYAGLYAISNIPLLLSPLGGAIADRFNRRNLMVIFDFISSAVILGFFLLLRIYSGSVILIGTVMVLLAAISAMYYPTVTASIPQLVANDKLEQSNGIVNGVQSLSHVAAPVLGGILYNIVGVQTLIVVSCAAFFLSAVMEIFIRIPYSKREQEGHIIPTLAKDMKAGFAYALGQRYILKCMILAAVLNMVLTPLLLVGGPIILRVTMQSSDALYGFGMGFVNFATILGALSIGFLAKKMRVNELYRWVLAVAFLIVPMGLSITPAALRLGYYPSYTAFVLCAFVIAFMMTIVSIFVITVVQKRTPNENMGKVMSIIMASSQCAAPIGQAIYGVVFEAFSAKIYLPILFVSILMVFMALGAKRILKNETTVA